MERPILKRKNQKKICTCPNCGYTEMSTRGVPCTERSCPKCGSKLRGEYCK